MSIMNSGSFELFFLILIVSERVARHARRRLSQVVVRHGSGVFRPRRGGSHCEAWIGYRFKNSIGKVICQAYL